MLLKSNEESNESNCNGIEGGEDKIVVGLVQELLVVELSWFVLRLQGE